MTKEFYILQRSTISYITKISQGFPMANTVHSFVILHNSKVSYDLTSVRYPNLIENTVPGLVKLGPKAV